MVKSKKSKRDRVLFLALSTLSTASLVGSFAGPLEKLELYRQTEPGRFNEPITRTYIIRESSLNAPYGFNRQKAKLFAQVHVDWKVQKILLLTVAAGCSVAALSLGKELVPRYEYEEEISRLKHEGEKELSIKSIKQRFAIANKSQQLLFLDQMKVLMEEFGSHEAEMLEVDELNALYNETESSVLAESPSEEAKSPDDSFRSSFPESMDSSSWKAIARALADGCTREEVIQNVLGKGAASEQYFDYLKSKFL